MSIILFVFQGVTQSGHRETTPVHAPYPSLKLRGYKKSMVFEKDRKTEQNP
jgi:hypothetical protein